MASPTVEGSIYASQPILVDQPIWRADLLESVAGGPGTWDRTHHHPKMRAWEPGTRQFDDAMSVDPIAFVGQQLSDLPGLLQGADMDADAVTDQDAVDLRAAVPEILDTVPSLLAPVPDARPPAGPRPR